jgi:hypothetical protein
MVEQAAHIRWVRGPIPFAAKKKPSIVIDGGLFIFTLVERCNYTIARNIIVRLRVLRRIRFSRRSLVSGWVVHQSFFD